MDKNKEKQLKRTRRRGKIRSVISGTSKCPRLNVFRSNRSMFLQLIDDNKGVTIVSANMGEIKEKLTKVEASFQLGELIAKKAIAKKIENVVFDRGGFRYHGRIKSAAEGARKGGLKF